MNILVTGGLGYIGSHTVVELINNEHEVIIVDNLVNSKIEVLDMLEKITGKKPNYYNFDITDENLVDDVFEKHEINGVIHFAGLKAVGESVHNPLEYYYNNLVSTIVLSKMCIKHNVGRFIFSSSATVYGDQPSPLNEKLELKRTTNPYGETKAISERMLTDLAKINKNFSVSLLRYFNPVGAHSSGLIGENPNGSPNNLMPLISKVAKGQMDKLLIFGDDYNTVDGTAVRDYVHVTDVAKGHVKAIEKLQPGVNIYNLGTGKGTTVLELIETFSRINNIQIPYEVVERREGDVPICYADVQKAEKDLGWKAEFGIEEMVRDVWRFETLLSLNQQA